MRHPVKNTKLLLQQFSGTLICILVPVKSSPFFGNAAVSGSGVAVKIIKTEEYITESLK